MVTAAASHDSISSFYHVLGYIASFMAAWLLVRVINSRTRRRGPILPRIMIILLLSGYVIWANVLHG
jgi:hypothetical protein